MTAIELGNDHGYQCPVCNKGNELNITATRRVDVRLYPDGTDDDGGDTFWDDDDPAWCDSCGWQGTVAGLVRIELEADDRCLME